MGRLSRVKHNPGPPSTGARKMRSIPEKVEILEVVDESTACCKFASGAVQNVLTIAPCRDLNARRAKYLVARYSRGSGGTSWSCRSLRTLRASWPSSACFTLRPLDPLLIPTELDMLDIGALRRRLGFPDAIDRTRRWDITGVDNRRRSLSTDWCRDECERPEQRRRCNLPTDRGPSVSFDHWEVPERVEFSSEPALRPFNSISA